jgi:HAD superfamily phosphoserine phosphatase-like hydrolase
MEAKNLKNDGLAVFDLCDTLYYSNTTHDFIDFFIARSSSPLKKLRFHLMNNQLSPLRYATIAFGVLAKRDLFKEFNVSMLGGSSEEQVLREAAAFVSEFLPERKIDRTHELIRECSAAGLRVVLCSSSIEPVVKAVAEKLGFPTYIATTLETADGRYTGRIAEEMSGKKLAAIAERLGAARIECAVSDNASDLDLLLAAKRGVAVAHSDRKRSFWAGKKLETIDVDL